MQKDGTALLVDGDNVPPEILAPLLARLENHGPVTERRIFRNWRSSRNATAWDDVSKGLAFERVDRYRTSAGKNASDIALVVTAMDLLHEGIRSFCIASGDTDFAPLVERLRRAGGRVVLIGHKGDGGILTDVADEYVDFRNLHRPSAPRREPGTRREPAAPSRTPAARAAPPTARRARKAPSRTPGPPRAAAPARALPPARRNAPAPRSRTAPAQRVQPPRAASTRPPQARARDSETGDGLDRLRMVLLDSYEVARTDGEVDAQGWVAVDRLGQVARSVDPSFSLGKYGLGNRASLSKAFGRLGDAFELEAVGRSGNRQYRVRRKD